MAKKNMRCKKVTSLWSVIERAQRKLENEGLSTDVVDAAITRGLEILLIKDTWQNPDPGERRGVRNLFVPVHGAVVKA